jgi:hypothetical protein
MPVDTVIPYLKERGMYKKPDCFARGRMKGSGNRLERKLLVWFFGVLMIVVFAPAGQIVLAQSPENAEPQKDAGSFKEPKDESERKSGREKLPEVREIEEQPTYPVEVLSKTKIYGGLTMIVQGALNNEESFGGDSADGTMSADLFIESEIVPKGFLLFRMDVAQGEGLTKLPPLFTNPDGTPTGTNNDVESWSSSDTLHINEVRYEQFFAGEKFRVSVGHLDLTSYFDESEFANKETFQFIAPIFNNNIAIDWGGNANFFGPGLVLNYHPIELIEGTIGYFEGDGDYTDLFDHPFIAGQIELETKIRGLEGHYSFILWAKYTSHPKILDPAQSDSKNNGFAISFDQELSEKVGVWVRFGTQGGEVAQFDRHASLGVQVKNPIGLESDVLGAAFGSTFISKEYKEASGLHQNEYYGEVYYNASLIRNVSLSPDIQYVVHPGGNGDVNNIFIYGLRAQFDF